MKLTKILALLLAACMLLGVLAGCGGGGNTDSTQGGNSTQGTGATDSTDATGGGSAVSEPQYGGHLNVCVSSGMYGIDPVIRAQVWAYMYMGLVFENPLTRDADNQIAPGVCDYELSEDNTVIKLWVREGLTFHDGSAVEIEDVKASIERACRMGNSVAEYLAPAIGSMEIADGILTITFTGNTERALSRLAAYQTWLAVIPKEVCDQFPDEEFADISYAIGTGPYKMTEWEDRVQITVERYDGYVPVEEGRTGYAGVKHAYLDSLTFWENIDYSSSTMAMLAGQYDISDVIESDYKEMASQAGITRENMGGVHTTYTAYFNNTGGNNICAKYPALRKAVMAAIDMEEMAEIVTDGACKVTGGAPVLDPAYDTTCYGDADWFGSTNQDAVDKYLDEARAEGYDDEPIQLITSSQSETYTLLTGYLDNAGVNYKITFMDGASAEEFTTDTANNWDIKFTYSYGAYSPTTLNEEYTTWYYNSEARDALLAELLELEVGSDAYMAKWQELHQQMVDDCSIIHFGFLDWYWNYRNGLYCQFEGVHPYFFNAYWDDPSAHQG